VLAANEAYADGFPLCGLQARAAKGLAVVTCIDSRIEPLAMLGLRPGDAKILRNVTDDVLRTLVLASYLLGVDRAMVIAPTAELGHDLRLPFRPPKRAGSIEPRPRLETFEELARFGEKRLSILEVAFRNKPLTLLEQRDPEIKRDGELAEHAGCAVEKPVGLVRVPRKRC